jgi:flagellin
MGISILNNVGIMGTVRNISTMQRSLLKTGSKLSSGLRINQASDDPAGLVISERMRAQIGSIAQELTNLDNNINKSNAADQMMAGLEDKLVELREMAIGAADSASNDSNTLQAYQQAADNAVGAYNRVIESSNYGSQTLLDGSEGSVTDLQSLEGIDLSSPEKAAESIEKIDAALSDLNAKHIEVGSNTANYMESFRSNLEIAQNNMVAAESAIRDTDYALEKANMMSLLIKEQAGLALLAQGNLNAKSVFGLLTA